MNDRSSNASDAAQAAADIDAATRRLMAALDALEAAVERRREADRDEDELATRIQALGADRSRLADELDGSLVKSRKLERTNRGIAEKVDHALAATRDVLGGEARTKSHDEPVDDEHKELAAALMEDVDDDEAEDDEE